MSKMTSGCPVCNGLTQLAETCPGCGASMEDCGKISEYVDSYGPYEEAENGTEETAITGDGGCVHFLQCPNCDENRSYTVNRDQI